MAVPSGCLIVCNVNIVNLTIPPPEAAEERLVFLEGMLQRVSEDLENLRRMLKERGITLDGDLYDGDPSDN